MSNESTGEKAAAAAGFAMAAMISVAAIGLALAIAEVFIEGKYADGVKECCCDDK